MLINGLGKLFFPRLPRWRRRREMKNVLFAVMVGILFAGAVMTMILMSGLERR
jgi:hypothetical protein